MTAIVVLAHAPLATAMTEVAKHVYPERAAQLVAIDVLPTQDGEEVAARLSSVISTLKGQEILVMVDAVGATPFNGAAQAQAQSSVPVNLVSGLNVPMLWRALCYCDEPLDALTRRALGGGQAGIQLHNRPNPQNQKPTGDNDDHHTNSGQ
jgi:mannose PTS system EIIA component